MLSTHFSSRSVHGGHGVKASKQIPPRVLLVLAYNAIERLKIKRRSMERKHHCLDGGNSALVIGFSRDQFRGLKNTILKGISEPRKSS